MKDRLECPRCSFPGNVPAMTTSELNSLRIAHLEISGHNARIITERWGR